MVYRFLKTLKAHEIEASVTGQRPPQYSSTAAVSLFMRHPDKLEELEQEHLTAFRRAALFFERTYQLVQDFLMMNAAARRRAFGCLAFAGAREPASRSWRASPMGLSEIKTLCKPA